MTFLFLFFKFAASELLFFSALGNSLFYTSSLLIYIVLCKKLKLQDPKIINCCNFWYATFLGHMLNWVLLFPSKIIKKKLGFA